MRGTHLNLSHVERRTFNRHFLNSVHCEFGLGRLDPKLLLSHEGHLKGVFGRNFGVQEVRKVFQGELVMNIQGSDKPHLQQKSAPTGA